MKTLNKKIISIIFFSPFISANADTVVTIPENPGAYEPFIIKATSDTGATHPSAVDIDIEPGNISIRYLRGFNAFVSPSRPLEVLVNGLPPGKYDIDVEVINFQTNGFNQVIISDTSPPTPTYGIYSSGDGRYFTILDENERDHIISTNWGYVIDNGFNVWPADGTAPDAAKPVCRFYSSLVHSYFYTADSEECDYLQSFDSGWQYEGIAFHALVPIEGACAAGTDPVWRLYNDRAAIGDSNHRYVTSSETYRMMIERGWVGEGVVFCSPPTSD